MFFHVLLALVLIIVAARLLGALFRRLQQPPVIGEVIAGILLGPSLLGRVALADARTCYLHLAGRLGVAWLETLEKRRFIHLSDGTLAMTRKGVAHFASLRLTPSRWPAGKPCLDWTERRSHLGGPLDARSSRSIFSSNSSLRSCSTS